jgi:hypothetical protein
MIVDPISVETKL